MCHYRWLLVVLLLFASPWTARGQMTPDEAYRRLQARSATHAKATPPRPTAPAAVAAVPAVADARPAADADSALLKARAGFHTVIRPGAVNPQDDRGQRPDVPPKNLARLIQYKSPIGPMWAYVTPDPGDGQRHPAVVWIHGGFAGLSSYLFSRDQPADNDQTPDAFLDAHFTVMCPSFRGHNDNPGKFEMFYGEVDDVVAAIDHLSRLPYVDPGRIYVVGHSTGGTMTLLAAEASGKVRAAFSLCGCPDVGALVASEADHHDAPFDFTDPREGELRSAVRFADHLHTPTWFFDQADSFYVRGARQMCLAAGAAHAPFHAAFLAPATHFDVVRPLTRLIARKLQSDTGPTCNFDATEAEVSDAFAAVFPGRRETVAAAVSRPPTLRVTPLARQVLEHVCAQRHLDPAKVALTIRSAAGGGYDVQYTELDPASELVAIPADGVTVAVPGDVLAGLGPTTVAVALSGGAVSLTAVPGTDTAPAEPDIAFTPRGIARRGKP